MQTTQPQPAKDLAKELKNAANYEEVDRQKRYTKLDILAFINQHLSENVSIDHLIYLVQNKL